jgi:serine/threonine protein kinase
MGTADDFGKGYCEGGAAGFDLPPEIMEEYELKTCLKMSPEKQVYLAVSKAGWRKYVIKAVSRECQEKLEEEYRLSQVLSHPGIIKARAFVEGTGFNYLIREYIEGNTVTERVEMTAEGKLTREEVLRILKGMCEILQYLHSQNPPIIHRDIKPDNIIVTEQGNCKLIDFGISRRLHKDNKSDTVVMGSQFAAPPEPMSFS